MFTLCFVIFVAVSIFAYHSTRPSSNKNAPTMAEMTTTPKIAIDQKISFRFFRSPSISCFFRICSLISFMTSVSKVPCLLGCLFLLIFFFLELTQKRNWMSFFYITHPSNLCTQCTSWASFSPPFSFSFSYVFLFLCHYFSSGPGPCSSLG